MNIQKIRNTVSVIAVVIAACSCTGNFSEVNRTPWRVTKDEKERDGYNIRANIIKLQTSVVSGSEHLYQFQDLLMAAPFGGYMADANGFGEKFETFNPSDHWIQAPFRDVFTHVFPAYNELLGSTDDRIVLAWADLLKVAAMHRVVDVYGPIPYTRMGSGKLTVPYDKQEDLYRTMIEELNAAIAVLTESRDVDNALYARFDRVYGGNLNSWIKFANSLKLRMALRMTYVNPSLARATAESAVSHPVGVITQNSENAFVSVPNNPMQLCVVQWGDHRVGADIVNYMNGFNDPRREKYFTLSAFVDSDGDPDPAIPPAYHGLRIGISSVPERAKQYSMPVVGVTDPLPWINAAEVTFLRAEGALWGWDMGGTAQALYNQAIERSFGQWGVPGAAQYANDASSSPAPYVDPLGVYSSGGVASGVKVRWDESGNFETNQEQIITQKWIAMFPNGMEAWAEYRRTGYPALMPVANNLSGGRVNTKTGMRRVPYPSIEYTENGEHLYEAVMSLGGPDNGSTRLWWDKK